MSDERSKVVKNESPTCRPTNGPPQIQVAAKPTNDDIVLIAFLLLNLSLTSHSLQMLVRPLFGKTFGPMSFHAGTLVSLLIFSFALPDSVKSHRRMLEVVSALQVVAAVAARSLGAFTIPLIEEPTYTAWTVHALLSFPAIGLGGSVWLHWARRFMDPEATTVGRLVVQAFTCISLVTIVKYAEPIIGDAVLGRVDFPPSATLICLGMTTYTLSVIFKPNRAVLHLSKLISVLSLFMVMLAVSVPPHTTDALSIQYQHFTPRGFIQVVDNHFTLPATRYLRLDASIIGTVDLMNDGKVGDARSTSSALLEALTLIRGLKDKRALVIGIQDSSSAKWLISKSFNTTVLDEREPLINAARDYLGLSGLDKVVVDEPVSWIKHYAEELVNNDETKFDVVVHDVFEGGELPAKLFTMEVWFALRSIIDAQGVLASKYVGKPSDVTFKSTLNMLRKNFKTCRAFHANSMDHPPLTSPEEFTEVVIFCTLADSLELTSPLSDAAFSSNTLSVLSNLDKRELDIAAVLGQTSPERYLLKEGDPVIVRWGRDRINEYWKLMRERFPDSVWYSY